MKKTIAVITSLLLALLFFGSVIAVNGPDSAGVSAAALTVASSETVSIDVEILPSVPVAVIDLTGEYNPGPLAHPDVTILATGPDNMVWPLTYSLFEDTTPADAGSSTATFHWRGVTLGGSGNWLTAGQTHSVLRMNFVPLTVGTTEVTLTSVTINPDSTSSIVPTRELALDPATAVVTLSGAATATQTCGNNVREGSEVCDGTDLAGVTCVSLGYTGGTLGCDPGCTGYEDALCTDSTVPTTCDATTAIDGSASTIPLDCLLDNIRSILDGSTSRLQKISAIAVELGRYI